MKIFDIKVVLFGGDTVNCTSYVSPIVHECVLAYQPTSDENSAAGIVLATTQSFSSTPRG